MINEYKIKESTFMGIPFYEVSGSPFIFEDLYELIGKNQFMSTFDLIPGSGSYNEYGESITGLLFISKEEIEEIEPFVKNKKASGRIMVKIDSPMPSLSQVQREELKYGGIDVSEIKLLTFHFFKKPIEYYGTGEKKVPNIIEIPLKNASKFDPDVGYQSLIIRKINSQKSLFPFEKDKFIGITLGLNNHIDSRILNFLGYNERSIQNNNDLWYHYYKTKERRKTITDEEKNAFANLKMLRFTSNLSKIINEIKKSNVNSVEFSEKSKILQSLIVSTNDFEPKILLYGNSSIYWDIDSYLHIVLRHVREHQIGTFKEKTPFPYRFKDLETLIEKILMEIEEEIQQHFIKNPSKGFRRSGRMSVPFNGDYYCIWINENRKLDTVYAR